MSAQPGTHAYNAAKSAHEALLERLEDAKADEAQAKVAFYSQVAKAMGGSKMMMDGEKLSDMRVLKADEVNKYAKDVAQAAVQYPQLLGLVETQHIPALKKLIESGKLPKGVVGVDLKKIAEDVEKFKANKTHDNATNVSMHYAMKP